MNNELKKKYTPAPLSLLADKVAREVEFEDKSDILEKTLNRFEINAKVVDFKVGPIFTEYFISINNAIPNSRFKLSRLLSLQDDICFALGLELGSIRIETIAQKNLIGIEVPNKKRSTVYLKELLIEDFMASSPLNVALGRDVYGNPIYCDIANMPHLLMSGTTGSGKSMCINSMLMSILYKASPEKVKFLMIDPKVVELNTYNGIPHLLTPVITDPQKAILSLGWAINEMRRRYKLFAECSVREIKDYNILASNEPLPRIIIVIDELSDLMMINDKEVEKYISELANEGRAAGIHMIIATQRTSVDVITSVIRSNIPSRIAFRVSSGVDSRTILETIGAEKLLFWGDMLYRPLFAPKPIRTQCAYVSDEEVDRVTAYLRDNYVADYNDEILTYIEPALSNDNKDLPDDELFNKAVEVVVELGKANVSTLQRRLGIGYPRAAMLIDELETQGVIGPWNGSRPREVLIKSVADIKTINIGFKNDPIFLLSIEECEKYRDRINNSSCFWLRSPAQRRHYVACVLIRGPICTDGAKVDGHSLGVLPALKYSNLKSKIVKSSLFEDRFLFNEFPFRIIDEENEIAIAETPLASNIFAFRHNNYEESEVRRKLLSWFRFGVWD